jgi:hypothetical protein
VDAIATMYRAAILENFTIEVLETSRNASKN